MTKKTEIAYVVTREHVDQVVPVAIFIHLEDGENTVAAHNQLYKDKGIEGFEFKLHATAFYD
jgi:hypothetical protein